MHLRYTTPVIISGAAFFGALSLLAFYPGLVTYDSIVQYEQSLSGHYIFYPPAMALTWGALNELHPGPILMTSLNLLLYWSCFAVLAVYCVAAAGRWSGALSLTAGLFPFLLSFSGVVWTDVLLASSWGLSCSILLMIARSDGRSWAARFGWCTAATLLVFGDAMRHIAAPAAIVLASALALHANLRTVASRVAVFVALAIPLAVAVPVSDYLVDAGDGWGIEKLMSWDLTGISYFSGQNYRAGGIRPDPIDNLECYSPRLFDGCELVPFVNRAEATARWGAAVAEQPLSYLKHRARIELLLNSKPYGFGSL